MAKIIRRYRYGIMDGKQVVEDGGERIQVIREFTDESQPVVPIHYVYEVSSWEKSQTGEIIAVMELIKAEPAGEVEKYIESRKHAMIIVPKLL